MNDIPAPARSPKLRSWHTSRAAVVYIRQSTPQQVLDHRESTARQYALAGRAVELGWARDQVVIIDDDLVGLSPFKQSHKCLTRVRSRAPRRESAGRLVPLVDPRRLLPPQHATDD